MRAFTPEGRGTPQHRAMNTRRLLQPDLPSNRPLGCIRFDAEVTQVLSEVLPPFPKGGLPDIQPLALLADRFNHDMDERLNIRKATLREWRSEEHTPELQSRLHLV